MAKPRIFVSSTYYDLKHIRASLSLFIDSLGYESILFEKGQIAFVSDDPLDISCYREAESADIFVLIIGGRYGSETSEVQIKDKTQYTDYNSITKKEYETASNNHIPIYILIEKGVYAEYQTYKLNKDNADIEYAHVDSINIFKLIDDIHSKPSNNPIFSFEKYNEIEEWLREQWAGIFKDFLVRRGTSKKLDSLQNQIKKLETLNFTLKNYLETLLKESDQNERDAVITQENQKIDEIINLEKLKENKLFEYIFRNKDLDINSIEIIDFIAVLNESISLSDFIKKLKSIESIELQEDKYKRLTFLNRTNAPKLLNDVNNLRKIINLPPFETQE